MFIWPTGALGTAADLQVRSSSTSLSRPRPSTGRINAILRVGPITLLGRPPRPTTLGVRISVAISVGLL
jgi:hypothetical protein